MASQQEVIRYLERNRGSRYTANHLSEQFGINKPNMNRILNRLVRFKFITMETDTKMPHYQFQEVKPRKDEHYGCLKRKRVIEGLIKLRKKGVIDKFEYRVIRKEICP